MQLWKGIYRGNPENPWHEDQGTPEYLPPAVAEHAWCNDHRIDWDTVEIMDTASKKMELMVKEAIHIQQTPKGLLPRVHNSKLLLLLYRDNGWQIPESWNATLRTDMMSSREARRPEQSIDGEAQAMEMDS